MARRSIIERHFIRFSWKHLAAFFTLVFFIHELHEISHVLTIRIRCSCWPDRDFIDWNLCGSCNSQKDYATVQLVGPVFNYVVMWTGLYWVLRSKITWKKSLGFAMILAALPLARIWGNADGGGDEIAVMRGLLNISDWNKYFFRFLSFVTVLFFCGIPLLVSYLFMANKNRLLIFAALILIPMFADKWVVEGLLNYIVTSSSLAQTKMAGTPIIVLMWVLLLVLLLAVFYRKLFTIAVPENQR